MSEPSPVPGKAKGRVRTMSTWGLILSPSRTGEHAGRFGLVVFSSGVIRKSSIAPPSLAFVLVGERGWYIEGSSFRGAPKPGSGPYSLILEELAGEVGPELN